MAVSLSYSVNVTGELARLPALVEPVAYLQGCKEGSGPTSAHSGLSTNQEQHKMCSRGFPIA